MTNALGGPLSLSVMGAGAWGTALAIALAREGHCVQLWGRDAHQIMGMQAARKNARYLPEVPFPSSLQLMSTLSEGFFKADFLLVMGPVAALRPLLQQLKQLGVPFPPILWGCKGFEASTGYLPYQVVQQTLGDVPAGALSGPSFAREVAAGLPAALTLATRPLSLAFSWTKRLNSSSLRLYANEDVVGVCVGGAVKNVIAIAAGVADGLALGANARAALITRGLAEITRLAVALGGRTETLTGLAGLGDLVLTCTGDLSRNRQVGTLLADQKPLETILAHLGHVAEGVPTALETERQATILGVPVPITSTVCQLLRGEVTAAQALFQLVSRGPRLE